MLNSICTDPSSPIDEELNKCLAQATQLIEDGLPISKLIGVQSLRTDFDGAPKAFFLRPSGPRILNVIGVNAPLSFVPVPARLIPEIVAALDIAQESAVILSREFISNITKDTIQHICACAQKTKAHKQSVATDLTHIKACTQQIAEKSSRGAGNWIVVSPELFSSWTDPSQEDLMPIVHTPLTGSVDLLHVGMLVNNTQTDPSKVIDVFTSVHLEENKILCGYRGTQRTQLDCGMVFCYRTLAQYKEDNHVVGYNGVFSTPDTEIENNPYFIELELIDS